MFCPHLLDSGALPGPVLGVVLADLWWILIVAGNAVGVFVLKWVLGIRWIPNQTVGIVEKLWSLRGSLQGGGIVALDGEAGYQVDILRGGVHLGYWPWQYRVHKVPLTVVGQGRIGYVFARDGEPLAPTQTLGRVVGANHFQDGRTFLAGDTDVPVGQAGRQREILREGVYAINLALFVVITEEHVYGLDIANCTDNEMIRRWQRDLRVQHGFEPVVVGRAARREPRDHAGVPAEVNPGSGSSDDIAIVSTHDGPALAPGQIIAPPVAIDPEDPDYHSNYQDIEAFLNAGGRRGRQYLPLTDGTYFLNRWFASVELVPKTVVPVGHVGVVVSYFGEAGRDASGEGFRHGESVGEGQKGVRTRALGPGKYAFNPYAGRIHLVPTTNFVLHWITGRTEKHRYDESLKSIDLVTTDAYEPILPLSVVVHIDYQKASNVVQRFGDVERLITQTLDPLLSAYFRDIAHKKTMLELLHSRDVIQKEAKAELQRRFAHFDIELVDVLIGKPSTDTADRKIENLLEQLRMRQLAREQVETFEEQKIAAEKLRTLKTAEAEADKQTELTNSEVEISIVRNRADAELAKARVDAEQTVISAGAAKKRRVLEAESESRAKTLLGEGESARVRLEGEAEAQVLQRKVASYGDPRLYALARVSEALSRSAQPLVPERVFVASNDGAGDGPHTGQGVFQTFIQLLLAERMGLVTPAEDAAGNGELVKKSAETVSDPAPSSR